jgi:uncharacterized protein (DUF427 family)
MKAVWNNKVLAESSDTIYIEGNQYFPPDSVNKEYFTSSETHTQCFWKGEASYYNAQVDGEINADAAWYYANPMPDAIKKVGKDFTNYVAFWNGVIVE